MPKIWYDVTMRDSTKISIDDMLHFLGQLQDEADDLCALSEGFDEESKYGIMLDICENAWQQAQVRAWINMATYKYSFDTDISII